MRIRLTITMSLVISVSAIIGCDGKTPTLVESAVIAREAANLATDRYPTEEELIAEGMSLIGYIDLLRNDGRFNGTSTYSANGTVRFYAVNQLQMSTTASVVNSEGGKVGSATESDSWSEFVPLFNSWTIAHTATATTGGNTCGVSGTPKVVTSGSLSVLVNWGPFVIWSGGFTRTGTPTSLAPCSPPPGGGGGGGGGGSGECEVEQCQEWFWYEDGVEVDHWWECTCLEYAE